MAQRMMASAAVNSGTRAYLCNLLAGVAAGMQSWAWGLFVFKE